MTQQSPHIVRHKDGRAVRVSDSVIHLTASDQPQVYPTYDAAQLASEQLNGIWSASGFDQELRPESYPQPQPTGARPNRG